jgi:hypothetical protein
MFGPYSLDRKYARDTSYRSSNLDTHLTHGCIQLFCGSWSALSARSLHSLHEIGCFPGFAERAHSALAWRRS